MKVKVYNMQGEEIEEIQLSDDIGQGEIKESLLREVVLAYQANQRQGTVSTKTRSEVRGGGRKPWIQKGTGRARAGSIRSPIWRGGGITFGPKPRNFKYSLSKRTKCSALKSSLRKKVKDGSVFILDKISLNGPKTKEMAKFLDSFSLKGRSLIIVNKWDDSLRRASSNIKGLRITLARLVCTFDILFYDNVFVTKEALGELEARLKDE
jgi:large subunit ribosomal protein L4